MGAAPSLLAVVVMWGLPLAMASGLPGVKAVRAHHGCLRVDAPVGHLWQALVVVPIAALGMSCLPRTVVLPVSEAPSD